MKFNVLTSAALLLCAASLPSWADQNVKDHGAKCNGTFDDTAAFKAAIAAAEVNGTVFVPVGHCVLTDTLTDISRILTLTEGLTGFLLPSSSR